MKPNPFVLPLVAVGGVLALVGLVLTIASATGGMRVDVLDVLAPVLIAVGVPILAAGLVVAGIDWRLTRRE